MTIFISILLTIFVIVVMYKLDKYLDGKRYPYYRKINGVNIHVEYVDFNEPLSIGFVTNRYRIGDTNSIGYLPWTTQLTLYGHIKRNDSGFCMMIKSGDNIRFLNKFNSWKELDLDYLEVFKSINEVDDFLSSHYLFFIKPENN